MSVLEILAEASQALEESLYQHNIVVRWHDGSLEGFSGTALSNARKAKESAEAKAQRRAKMIKKEFTILDGKDFAQLDSAQKKRLKRDWDLNQKMDESVEINEDNDVEKEEPSEVKAAKKSDHDLAYKIDSQVKNRLNNWESLSKKNELADNDDVKYYKKIWQKLSDILDDEFISQPLKEADESEKSEPNEKEVPEELKAKSKDIAKELVSALSVFLFAAEGLIGQEFESAKEAEDFIFSAMKSLRTNEKGTLTSMLRRFDRIGGERMANMFKRSLSKDLAK